MPGSGGVGQHVPKKRKAQLQVAIESTHANSKRRLGVHLCNYCNREISQAIRISCAVCSGFQLCLYCFSTGVELKQHQKDHDYQVHGDLSFPLYDLDWGADEEMLLLEGIDASGLGNWFAVSSHVSSKTALECKEHYFSIYIRSPAFPLPHATPQMLGQDPLEVLKGQQALSEGESVIRQNGLSPETEMLEPDKPQAPDEGLVGALRPNGIGDAAGIDQGPDGLQEVPVIQPTAGGSGIDISLPPPKKVRPGKVDSSNPGSTKVKPENVDQQQLSTRGLPNNLRPMPADPRTPLGAEQPNMSTVEVGGLQQDISGFHAKRCEFDHEYDNDAELLISEIEFLPTDTPEEQLEKLQLVEIYNQRLTEREKRRATVMSRGLMDMKKTQASERRQTPAERELRSKMCVFARYHSAEDHERLVEGMLLEQRLRTRLEELKEFRAAGVRTFEDAEEYDADKRRQAAAGKAGDRSQRYLARTGNDDLAVLSQAAVVSLGDSGGRTRELSRLRTSSSLSQQGPSLFSKEAGNTAAQLAAWRHRRGFALDITAFEGAEALSAKERQLCVVERLLPHQYLACKASLLREAEQRGDPAISGDVAYLSDNAITASPAHSGSKGTRRLLKRPG